MRHALAVATVAALVSGCSLVSVRLPMPSVSPPPGAPSIVVTMEHGQVTWPDRSLPPGRYRADWWVTCPVSLGIQGTSVVMSDDPPTGSREFTIEPGRDGTSMGSACYDDDTVRVEIR